MKLLFFLGLGIFLTTHLSAQITFTQAIGSPTSLTGTMRGVTSSDVNNDGKKDLLIASLNNNLVYVLLGNGNGQFTQAPGSPVTVNGGPVFIAVADYNADTRADMAIANYNSASISIFLGTGTGAFTQAAGSPYITGGLPYCISAADFNLDGKMDLITSSVNSNQIFMFMGNGAGSFTANAGFPITSGSQPYHVSTGMYNADSFPDFAFVNGNGNSLQVYLGNGAGTFTQTAGSPYNTGNQPRTIASNDINNDGFTDFVIANNSSNNLSVFLGSSSGVFTNAPGSPVSVGVNPYQATIADYDLNGNLDLVVTNAGSNSITILSGAGTGSFAFSSNMGLGSMPQPICTDDFNGDNKSDLAIGDWLGSDLNVLLNSSTVCALSAGFTFTVSPSGQVNFSGSSNSNIGTTNYFWNFGNGNTASGITASNNYTSTGTYTVNLVVTTGTPACSYTVTHVVTVTSIIKSGFNNITSDTGVNLYPNPTNGFIVVESTLFESVENNQIVINTLPGQEKLKYKLSGIRNLIDLNSLENGLYLYKIFKNGELLKTGKLNVNR